MSDSETEIDKPVSVPANSRARIFFWSNIGILITGFAIVVLIVAVEMTSYGLTAVNTRLINAFKDISNEFSQSQTTILTTQKNLNNVSETVQKNSEIISDWACYVIRKHRLYQSRC